VTTRRLTHLGGARVTLGIGVLLVASGQRRLGYATLAANVLSHLAVQVLKRTVARPRPCDASGRPLALVDLPDPFSFPSGHAAAATAVAGTIALHSPLLTPVLLPLVAVVAASRVLLRVHHISDVVAGAGLGLAGALAATVLLNP
jgi:undecaprenyl-diphosphatase